MARFQGFILERCDQGGVDRFVFGRFFVGGDISFVIPQHDLVIGITQEVVRIQRDLAPAAGRIHDVGRDSETGGMPTQGLNDLDPFTDRCAEMPCTVHQVALVKVIGTDPDADQVVHQLALDERVVIHAGQQYGLVAQRDTGPSEFITGFSQFSRDLIGMVDVDIEPQRMEFLQHVRQVSGDPLGHEDRNP